MLIKAPAFSEEKRKKYANNRERVEILNIISNTIDIFNNNIRMLGYWNNKLRKWATLKPSF